MRKNQLVFFEPANIAFWGSDGWNHALPVGNGRLGAMVFGGIEAERIQLNEDTLWSGSINRDRINPDSIKYYKKIRSLLQEGSIREAEKLLRNSMVAPIENECSYSTAGDLIIHFDWKESQASNYRRTLDLDTAIASSSYEMNETYIEEEVFSDAVHQLIVVHMKATDSKTKKPASILSLSAGLLRGNHPDHYITNSYNVISLSGKECGENSLRYCVSIKAEQTGGTLSTIGGHLIIKDASEFTFYIAIYTDFYRDNPYNQCMTKLSQKFSYEQIRKEHINDYQSYFNRMHFEMPASKEVEHLPINERLDRVKSGAVDLGLIALYYNFGRYLLISCSRPHTMAANLQGIWNSELNPAWGSKYTININTEMNYWPAEGCNLSDCHEPLFDLIKRMLPSGRKVARKMYGCSGFMAHHNTDLCGDCAPQDIWMPATIWPMGAAWLCTHIWTHYSYTLNEDFLKEFYPVLCEAALFFTEYLFENEDGQLVTGPSTSPENTYLHPSKEQGTVCIGPSMDSEIIRDLFQSCISSATILHCEDSFTDKLKDMIEKLPKLRIGRYGQIMEWAQDYEEVEPGHRHISQLYALYPSNQITGEKTPDLMIAARKTLERRLLNGGGHTGWSRAWIINMWARLQDSEKAGENVQALLARSTSDNLFDMHPPFQIDGNFGGVAGINEMLVQSHDGKLQLLPALPSTWYQGCITGLCAREHIEVSMSWDNHTLTYAKIDSLSGRPIRLELPNPLTKLTTEAHITKISETQYEFCAAAPYSVILS